MDQTAYHPNLPTWPISQTRHWCELQNLLMLLTNRLGSSRPSKTDREVYLWMYSRVSAFWTYVTLIAYLLSLVQMAMGMTIDLGIGFETTVQLAPTEDGREKIRLTWWAVLLVDRINSWGTGDFLLLTSTLYLKLNRCFSKVGPLLLLMIRFADSF